jgi:hypothetical protein
MPARRMPQRAEGALVRQRPAERHQGRRAEPLLGERGLGRRPRIDQEVRVALVHVARDDGERKRRRLGRDRRDALLLDEHVRRRRSAAPSRAAAARRHHRDRPHVPWTRRDATNVYTPSERLDQRARDERRRREVSALAVARRSDLSPKWRTSRIVASTPTTSTGRIQGQHGR